MGEVTVRKCADSADRRGACLSDEEIASAVFDNSTWWE
jgi:hypothetical protein